MRSELATAFALAACAGPGVDVPDPPESGVFDVAPEEFDLERFCTSSAPPPPDPDATQPIEVGGPPPLPACPYCGGNWARHY